MQKNNGLSLALALLQSPDAETQIMVRGKVSLMMSPCVIGHRSSFVIRCDDVMMTNSSSLVGRQADCQSFDQWTSSKGDPRRRASESGEEVGRFAKSGTEGPNRDGAFESQVSLYGETETETENQNKTRGEEP